MWTSEIIVLICISIGFVMNSLNLYLRYKSILKIPDIQIRNLLKVDVKKMMSNLKGF